MERLVHPSTGKWTRIRDGDVQAAADRIISKVYGPGCYGKRFIGWDDLPANSEIMVAVQREVGKLSELVTNVWFRREDMVPESEF